MLSCMSDEHSPRSGSRAKCEDGREKAAARLDVAELFKVLTYLRDQDVVHWARPRLTAISRAEHVLLSQASQELGKSSSLNAGLHVRKVQLLTPKHYKRT